MEWKEGKGACGYEVEMEGRARRQIELGGCRGRGEEGGSQMLERGRRETEGRELVRYWQGGGRERDERGYIRSEESKVEQFGGVPARSSTVAALVDSRRGSRRQTN